MKLQLRQFCRRSGLVAESTCSVKRLLAELFCSAYHLQRLLRLWLCFSNADHGPLPFTNVCHGSLPGLLLGISSNSLQVFERHGTLTVRQGGFFALAKRLFYLPRFHGGSDCWICYLAYERARLQIPTSNQIIASSSKQLTPEYAMLIEPGGLMLLIPCNRQRHKWPSNGMHLSGHIHTGGEYS